MNEKKQKKFSFAGFFFFSLALILLLGSVLIIKAPAIISSPKGKAFLLDTVNGRIKGTLAIESLSLSWKNGQEIKGFSLTDGETSVVFGSLKTDLPLLDLISSKKLTFGKTKLQDLYAKIYLEETKEPPAKKVETAKKPKKEAGFIILPEKFSGEIEIENANIMVSAPGIKPARFTQIGVKFFAKPEHKLLSFSADGKAAQDTLSGLFDIKGRIENFGDIADFHPSTAKAEINATLKSVPTEGIDSLFKTDGLFETAFGNSLDLETAVSIEKGMADILLTVVSPMFSADLGVHATNEIIKLSKESNIKCSVSPALLEKIAETAPFRLKSRTVMEATVKKLELPLKKSGSYILSILYDTKLNAEIRVSTLSVDDNRNKYPLTLDPLYISVSSEGLGHKTSIKMSGGLASPGILSRGKISVESELRDIMAPDGSINKDLLSLNLISSAEGLSVRELDRFLDTDQILNAVIGETVSIKASSDLKEMKGPFNLDIAGDNANARISASLNDGYISLRENIRAEIKVTPALGKTVLKNINPLLITAVSAKKPILATVSRDEFYFPLKDFSVSDVTVKEAVVELGEITLENGGILSPLVSFLKSASGQSMNANFTPLKASLRKGIARYSRMDTIIANSFHTATWGSIDIVNDRLDIMLGLTSDTLDKVFDLEDLPENYILEIPIYGSTSNPKVDWSKAAATIGSLLLKKTIDKRVPGLGSAIDDIFNKSGQDDTGEKSPGSMLMDSLNRWLEDNQKK
ncbi:MAG: hypothetical protein PHO00_05060 [bacterium]|nr:hypothetical protein [bacterium]